MLRHSPATAGRRARELIRAIRRIAKHPELSPVRIVDPETGLHLRRCNVAQFAIVYVYYPPSPLEPSGLVSLRAFRHAGEADVLWEVREPTFADALAPTCSFLSTRIRSRSGAWQPLATYGEITFTPNTQETDIHTRSP